jgi:hypothetical protein
VIGPGLPPAALAIDRSTNVAWLRRDARELWFEARGFDPDPDAGGAAAWTRVATDAAWLVSAGDAVALLAGDAVTAFTAAAARPLFAAPGLAAALAGARAAVVDPVARRVLVATDAGVIAIGAAGTASIAPLPARALALSSDRRRLYAATDAAIWCVALPGGEVTEVVAIPDGATVTAMASAPAGLAATVTVPGRDAAAAAAALVGINLRYGSWHPLRALPAELAGAPVVADHTGGLTLAAPARLYRCGFDGGDLAVCFAPAAAPAT